MLGLEIMALSFATGRFLGFESASFQIVFFPLYRVGCCLYVICTVEASPPGGLSDLPLPLLTYLCGGTTLNEDVTPTPSRPLWYNVRCVAGALLFMVCGFATRKLLGSGFVG